MFSPKDSGLQLPLNGKLYHGRNVICDAVGNELFILEVIRPSIEARQMLAEWVEAICEKFNNGKTPIIQQMEPSVVVPDPVPIVKRGRGRPRKVHAND